MCPTYTGAPRNHPSQDIFLISLTDVESKQITSPLLEVSSRSGTRWDWVKVGLGQPPHNKYSQPGFSRKRAEPPCVSYQSSPMLKFLKEFMTTSLCLLWPSLSGPCGRQLETLKHSCFVTSDSQSSSASNNPFAVGSWFITPKHVCSCTGFLSDSISPCRRWHFLNTMLRRMQCTKQWAFHGAPAVSLLFLPGALVLVKTDSPPKELWLAFQCALLFSPWCLQSCQFLYDF